MDQDERIEVVAKAILNTQQTWGKRDQVWNAAHPDHRANALKYAKAALKAIDALEKDKEVQPSNQEPRVRTMRDREHQEVAIDQCKSPR